MHLLVDLGNSRLKWAQQDSGQWLPGATLHRDRDIAELLDEVWGRLPAPTAIVMTSVAPDETRRALEQWIRNRWAVTVHRVQAQRQQLDVVNTYHDPTALGADRWAALLGARGLTPRACAVVDCGTAVTLDALSAEGVFAGGVIFPGLRLLRQSLGAGTAGIGSMEGNDASCLARVTADGVAAGTLFGLAGAIERCLHEQEQALGETLEVFMTGGDAALLALHLARPVLEVSDLVLKGLARVSEELIK